MIHRYDDAGFPTPGVILGVCPTCSENVITDDAHGRFLDSYFHNEEGRRCVPDDLAVCAGACGELEEKRRMILGYCGDCTQCPECERTMANHSPSCQWPA